MLSLFCPIQCATVALLAVGTAVAAVPPCPVSVSTIQSNGSATIHVSVGGSGCGGTVPGFVINLFNDLATVEYRSTCTTNPCEGDLVKSTQCWRPGTVVPIHISAGCRQPDSSDGSCAYVNTQYDTSFTVNVETKPTIGASYNVDTGNLHIKYSFPFVGANGVGIEVDGNLSWISPNWGTWNTAGASPSGEFDYPLGFACSSGIRKVKVVANRCNLWSTGPGDPDYWAETPLLTVVPKECPSSDTKSKKNCKPCNAQVDDPINVGSGDVNLELPLFTIAHEVFPLNFALSYHGKPPIFSTNGLQRWAGWTHSFHQSVRRVGPNRLQWFTGDGEQHFFDASSGTLWTGTAPVGNSDTITAEGTFYVVHHPDGTIAKFDAATGRWLENADRWGNRITGMYDGEGNLVTITDAAGRQIQLGYKYGQMETIQLPDGGLWRFQPSDDRNLLLKIFDPLHAGTMPWRSMVYSYWYGRLTEVKDDAGKILIGHDYYAWTGTDAYTQAGRTVHLTYDTPSRGQITATQVVSGVTRTAVFTKGAEIRGSTIVTHIEGACPSCGVGSTDSRWSFDENGYPASETDAAGHVTQTTNDSYGNVITKVEAVGTPKERTTQYAYGMASWPTFLTSRTETSSLGTLEEHSSWNADETVLTVTMTGRRAPGETPVTYTRTLTYDAHHRLVSEDGPRTDVADVTSRTYYPDDDADLNRRGRLKSVTNAAGQTTTFADYDLYGIARTITDANGVVTTRTTDARGRITSETIHAVAGDPNESSDYTTSYVHDSRDRLTSVTTPHTSTRYVYQDGTNLLTDTIRLDPSGNERERHHVVYDVLGEKTSESDDLCATPAPTCASWTTKRSQSFVYDVNGRLSQILQPVPAGANVTYAYDADGRLVSVKDENHAAPNTTYGYDELNRLSTVTQTLATAPGGAVVTRYAYDTAGNLESVTDPNGNTTTYTYDDFRRMTSQRSPVTGATTYEYDPAGNLTRTVDANGSETVRTYDALGRVLTSVSRASDGTSETVTYRYDDTRYGVGRLAQMFDPTGSAAYEYERRGLLTSEVKAVASATYTTLYGYDADGNRRSITTPSGQLLQYEFDWANRPFSVFAGSTPIVTSATYLPFGPLAQMAFGNGTTRTADYDVRYRPLRNRLTGATGTIADYTYVEDAVGNILQIHDALNGGFNRDFEYDDLNRLTSANGGASLWGTGSYQYDSMGNILALSLGTRAASFAYRGSTPMLAAATENGAVRPVGYDLAGNEVTVGGESFRYSPRNFMAVANDTGYFYDGRGIRTITGTFAAVTAFTVAPTSVTGGDTTEATITLNGAAPAGGVAVSLSSLNPVATVPSIVVVPEGSVSTTVSIETTPVAVQTAVTLSATLGASTSSAVLAIQPPTVARLELAPGSVIGGSTSLATVTLNGKAPAGGFEAAVASESPAAVVPSFVVVATGATSATFDVGTMPVSATTDAVISAGTGAAAQSATLRVIAARLASATVTPAVVTGGGPAVLTVSLDGPAPAAGASVTLSSDSPEATLPASVTIAANAVSALVGLTTTIVYSQKPVTLSATYNGGVQAAQLILNPPPVTIGALTLDPASVVGGLPSTGTVTLTNPAPPGGIAVEITSDDESLAVVPPVVVVPEGLLATTFSIETTTVLTAGTANIDVTLGVTTKSSMLNVVPPPNTALYRLDIVPPNVPGGSAATGTVELTGVAPNGGADVTLSSSDPATVIVPSRVTVKRGERTATFSVGTMTVSAPVTGTISGSYGGLTQRDTLTVISPSAVYLAALTLSPTSVPSGGTVTGTVTLSAPAPAGGILVSLDVKHRNVATLPPSVLVPGNVTTATFTITAGKVNGKSKTTDVMATYGNVRQIAVLEVTSPVAHLAIPNVTSAPVVLSLRAEPVALPSRAPLISRRISLYTPELHLLVETEASPSPLPSVRVEYVWFGDEPVGEIEVNSQRIQYYFTDHLGAPILTTSTEGATEWRVEREPFGPEFVMRAGADHHQPLAFPGQEIERTEHLQYNVFRWYRPAWGRYSQTDPVITRTFDYMPYVQDYEPLVQPMLSYAGNNPSLFFDPLGLAIKRCFRPFKNPKARVLSAIAVPWRMSHPAVPGSSKALMHEFLYNTDTNKSQGYDPKENTEETLKGATCYDIPEPTGTCVWKNFTKIAGKGSAYDLLKHNCQTTINQTIIYCKCKGY